MKRCGTIGIALDGIFDGTGIYRLRRGFFGTRIGRMGHGSFAFGGDFWNTDWTDGARIFCLRLGFFRTWIGRMRH